MASFRKWGCSEKLGNAQFRGRSILVKSKNAPEPAFLYYCCYFQDIACTDSLSLFHSVFANKYWGSKTEGQWFNWIKYMSPT